MISVQLYKHTDALNLGKFIVWFTPLMFSTHTNYGSMISCVGDDGTWALRKYDNSGTLLWQNDHLGNVISYKK